MNYLEKKLKAKWWPYALFKKIESGYFSEKLDPGMREV